jgi:hypothetical protein
MRGEAVMIAMNQHPSLRIFTTTNVATDGAQS